jgi:hypothetical protein
MTSTTAGRTIAIEDAERMKAGSIGTRRFSTASRICTDAEGNRVPNLHSAVFRRATGCGKEMPKIASVLAADQDVLESITRHLSKWFKILLAVRQRNAQLLRKLRFRAVCDSADTGSNLLIF